MSEEFVKDWDILQPLGEGAFGEVRLMMNRTTHETIAAKVIDLSKFPDALDPVRKEILIHSKVIHENVIKYYGHRREGNIEYIFLEYASGGELFDRIEPDIGMNQSEAHNYFTQLICGVEFLHSQGVAHRDIKPENLLLSDKDVIKISDFGLATIFIVNGEEKLLTQKCGTFQYMAPEIVSANKYRADAADIWSCGIVLTALLAGELPWDSPSVDCLEFREWKQMKTYRSPWTKINNLSLALLRKILCPTVKQRYSISQIKNHQWFKKETFGKKRVIFGVNTSPISSHKKVCGERVVRPSASQPVPRENREEIPHSDDMVHFFTQPDHPENMLLSTQYTFGSLSNQNPYQKLVKRMTRFFTNSNAQVTLRELTGYFEKMGYQWKRNSPGQAYTRAVDSQQALYDTRIGKDCPPHIMTGQLTIETTDKRKNPLIFKTSVIEMASKEILVDFRLSRGCGIEFKRHFVGVKHGLEEVIMKGPITWPLAVATNSLP